MDDSETVMQKFTRYSVLVLGLASSVLAEDPAVPATTTAETVPATVESPATAAEAVKPDAAEDAKPADPAAPIEAQVAEPAKPEAPAETATPAATAETKETKPAAETEKAKSEATDEDPDVAARRETAYPLDGEEWKEYPLGILEMEMGEVIEDLASGKPKPPALATQPRIISRLDFMIAALEKKTGGKGGGLGGDKPAEKSTLKKGKMQNGNLRAVKNEGDRWANLTPKEREKVLQSQGEGFPAGYEDVLADYFRKLSKSEKPAAAAPVKDAGSEKPKPPAGSK